MDLFVCQVIGATDINYYFTTEIIKNKDNNFINFFCCKSIKKLFLY